MSDKDPVVTVKDLPMTFTVKYLGNHPAKGLWGMKHTRKPVDFLVAQAKNLPPNIILPVVRICITKDGISYQELTDTTGNSSPVHFPVDVISYGVQDLVYTRVFSMIIVTDDNLENGIPFVCHSFVCESRDQARKITYALAAAFQDYSRRVKEENKDMTKVKRFAIDLRTPEEQAEASDGETDA
ncbi:uncharacterized protein LOC108910532 [Anoplophora glabripennis]|uniref:PID domain-containing protein n=1 Tax=Anoplophora glabripennis TaxID=217634 RepID=V5G2E8_ANOGL|nr:uncharacterized protein LOC108910532 [Anoplophora glabripennis]